VLISVSFEKYEIALYLGKIQVQFLILICYKSDVLYKLCHICIKLAIHYPSLKYHFTMSRDTITYNSCLSVVILYNLVHFISVGGKIVERKIAKDIFYRFTLNLLLPLALLF
jgi:hypothetical protein